jgi:adenosine kinase
MISSGYMESSRDTILVTGTIAQDHLFQYSSGFLGELREATQQDVLSISFQPHQYVKRHGGTGANISWNLALLGTKPMLVGNIGPDGLPYKQILQERGINTQHVEVKQTAMTATGFCCTDRNGHQIWFFYRGADAVGNWPDLPNDPKAGYAIMGARHHPIMLEGLEWCKENNVPVLFDPGQEIMRFTQDELKHAIELSTGIIMNEFEWGIFGERLKMTAEEVASNVEYLIVTRGESGHTIYTKDEKQTYPRCNCDKPVDPTGAGDAFRAGLICGLTNEWSLENASKLGAAIASLVVEYDGTLLPSLDRALLQKRVQDAYGESLPPLSF